MATMAALIKAVRLESGDRLETFRDSFRGTGDKDDYDLPAINITTAMVFRVNSDGSNTTFVEDTDYTLDRERGVITFTEPPEQDDLIVVEGDANGIFTDEEWEHFIDMAASQHLKDRTVELRYRDGRGFIRYDNNPMEIEDLPHEEEILLVLLATIEAMWALTTDASRAIDVVTAEGTHIPRSQRWRQMISQIDILTDKYEKLSLAMGVGLMAPEVMTLRRVSRTTGRLVPIFKPREYDETGPPIRKTPPRSNKDVDEDGPLSPWRSGGWGF